MIRPEESFIGMPVRSLQTMLRVIGRDDPLMSNLIPDGIYGTQTRQAVTDFQRQHRLPVNGVTDQATWEAVVAAFEPMKVRSDRPMAISAEFDRDSFEYGDEAPEIMLAQAMLTTFSRSLPNFPAPGNGGVLDDSTQASLRQFQCLCGLPEDGKLDKLCWKHLTLHYPVHARRVRRANQYE